MLVPLLLKGNVSLSRQKMRLLEYPRNITIASKPFHMQYRRTLFRVLSRIFCLGGGVDPKKILEPRSREKKFIRPSGGPENCEKIVFRMG